jgi:hypothetical protein
MEQKGVESSALFIDIRSYKGGGGMRNWG